MAAIGELLRVPPHLPHRPARCRRRLPAPDAPPLSLAALSLLAGCVLAFFGGGVVISSSYSVSEQSSVQSVFRGHGALGRVRLKVQVGLDVLHPDAVRARAVLLPAWPLCRRYRRGLILASWS